MRRFCTGKSDCCHQDHKRAWGTSPTRKQPAFASSSNSKASSVTSLKANKKCTYTHFSERKTYRMEFLISANNLILDNWLISSETKQQHEIAFEQCFPSQNHGINHAVQEAQKDAPEHKDEHIFEVLTTYGFVKNAKDTRTPSVSHSALLVCLPLTFHPSLLKTP